jgi:hypothetical protein
MKGLDVKVQNKKEEEGRALARTRERRGGYRCF